MLPISEIGLGEAPAAVSKIESSASRIDIKSMTLLLEIPEALLACVPAKDLEIRMVIWVKRTGKPTSRRFCEK